MTINAISKIIVMLYNNRFYESNNTRHKHSSLNKEQFSDNAAELKNCCPFNVAGDRVFQVSKFQTLVPVLQPHASCWQGYWKYCLCSVGNFMYSLHTLIWIFLLLLSLLLLLLLLLLLTCVYVSQQKVTPRNNRAL